MMPVTIIGVLAIKFKFFMTILMDDIIGCILFWQYNRHNKTIY